MTATFYVGDAIEVMSKLPEKSVDLILTSPPFLALRSYLPADHPDKALEGGSQTTPGMFIDWLVDVVEACDRVLAPHGSMCIELGDTYSGSTADGGDNRGNDRYPVGRSFVVGQRSTKEGWPLAKSLSLIPELFRLTLVYGTNPLTGRTTERWRLRNVVRWVRPNPPVGALGDKFRPATSELMVFCKSAKRYFDLDAVREPYSREQIRAPLHTFKDAGNLDNNKGRVKGGLGEFRSIDSAGAPPLDWWQIPEASMLRRPCEHGRYDPHFIRNSSDLDCPGGEFLLPQSAQAPPLDWWNIPLLEGEEETRYGPGEKRKAHAKPGDSNNMTKAAGVGTGRTEADAERWATNLAVRTEHPLGSPPPRLVEHPPRRIRRRPLRRLPPRTMHQTDQSNVPRKSLPGVWGTEPEDHRRLLHASR